MQAMPSLLTKSTDVISDCSTMAAMASISPPEPGDRNTGARSDGYRRDEDRRCRDPKRPSDERSKNWKAALSVSQKPDAFVRLVEEVGEAIARQKTKYADKFDGVHVIWKSELY